MMPLDPEIIARVIIVVSVAVLGYNLLHLSTTHSSMQVRIRTFREAARNEGMDKATLAKVQLAVYMLLSVSYLLLLWGAQFSWWVLALFGTKFLFGGALGFWMQDRTLRGRKYRMRHHLLLQADSLLSISMLAFTLWALVVG